MTNDKVIIKTIDISGTWWHLNRYALGNVQDELHIGVVVVVSPSWHRYVVICHFDVLCKSNRNQGNFLLLTLNHLPTVTNVIFLWIWGERPFTVKLFTHTV